jgi:cytochrome c-type biogenesis protein CcmH
MGPAAVTVFVALAAALTVAVLALVLWPLWRGARGLAIAIAVPALLATVALYQLVGTPAALDAQALQPPETLADAVVQLERELQRDPSRAEGWRLLGRAYATEQRLADSRDAYARAAALEPDNPDVLVEAAQASALADAQRRFDAQAVARLERALDVQPEHQRARWFLGVAQRQAGRHADAAATWEALLPRVDAATAASLRQQIDAARVDAGMSPLPPAADAAASGNALAVRVSLDPEFASRVRLRGDATVFVIARAAGGPPMPVAVEKHGIQELPLTATLDDGDSPMPTAKLSSLQEVELVARLSASGDATKAEGDIESAPVRVKLPAKGPVALVIGAPSP